MSNNSFDFSGDINDLRMALQNMPEELTSEGGRIIEEATNMAAADIKAAYPVVTGNLRDGLRHEVSRNRFGASGIVRNVAPHGHLYDGGTGPRKYVTKKGNVHFTGTMPRNALFAAIMSKRRRWMYGQLAELLERHGLQVTGT